MLFFLFFFSFLFFLLFLLRPVIITYFLKELSTYEKRQRIPTWCKFKHLFVIYGLCGSVCARMYLYVCMCVYTSAFYCMVLLPLCPRVPWFKLP